MLFILVMQGNLLRLCLALFPVYCTQYTKYNKVQGTRNPRRNQIAVVGTSYKIWHTENKHQSANVDGKTDKLLVCAPVMTLLLHYSLCSGTRDTGVSIC